MLSMLKESSEVSDMGECGTVMAFLGILRPLSRGEPLGGSGGGGDRSVLILPKGNKGFRIGGSVLELLLGERSLLEP